MATISKSRGVSPILGIELTEQEARVVHLAKQGSQLKRLGQLCVAFEASDASDRTAVLQARGATLRAALDEAGISTRNCIVSLPRHRVILRELNLPDGSPAELRQMAELRMERELPFPIEQVVMGLRLLPPAAGATESVDGPQRVLAAFVQQDRLSSHLSVLEAAGIEPQGAGVSALYAIRAFQLSEGFVPGKPQGLVAVGQTMTEIAVLNGTHSLLSRSASTGLARVDPQADPTSEGNQQFLDELARTFTSFHGGKDAIQTIYLTDHGAGCDGVTELLRKRFDVPIESLHPFRCELLEQPETFEDDHLYVTAMGAAATYLTGASEIDFLPPKRGPLDWLKWDSKIAALTTLVVLLIALYLVPPLRFAAMQAQTDQLTDLQKELEQTAKGYQVYRDQVEELGPWNESRTPWIEVLERMSERIDTQRGFLTHLQFRDKGTLVLRGLAKTNRDCTILADALKADPAFDAELKGSSKGRGRGAYVYDFTIQIKLIPGKLKMRLSK